MAFFQDNRGKLAPEM